MQLMKPMSCEVNGIVYKCISRDNDIYALPHICKALDVVVVVTRFQFNMSCVR